MSDYTFAITDDDFWVPPQCRDWPAEAQPRFHYRVPTAGEVQAYDRELVTIREAHGLESQADFYSSPEILELWLKTSLRFLKSTTNVVFNGEPLNWTEIDDTTKRVVLQKLAGSGIARLVALGHLVQQIRTGLSLIEKKSSPSTSASAGATKTPDVDVRSVPEATTPT